eukprot:3758484-Amphidinium_carterae.1
MDSMTHKSHKGQQTKRAFLSVDFRTTKNTQENTSHQVVIVIFHHTPEAEQERQRWLVAMVWEFCEKPASSKFFVRSLLDGFARRQTSGASLKRRFILDVLNVYHSYTYTLVWDKLDKQDFSKELQALPERSHTTASLFGACFLGSCKANGMVVTMCLCSSGTLAMHLANVLVGVQQCEVAARPQGLHSIAISPSLTAGNYQAIDHVATKN